MPPPVPPRVVWRSLFPKREWIVREYPRSDEAALAREQLRTLGR